MRRRDLTGEGTRVSLKSEGRQAGIIDNETGTVIGRVVVAAGPGDLIEIESLSIDEPHRGRGAGSEAFRLLLSSLGGGQWRTLRASAPAGMGLAAYFWMRMGFRPLFGAREERRLVFERRLR